VRVRLAPHFLLPAGSAAVVVFLLAVIGRRPVSISASIHLMAVAGSAAAAALAAIVLTMVAARRHDGRATLIGTGFSVMAAILAVHGLSTPTVLFDRNSVTAFSGAATLPVGGLILALAALPGLRRPRDPRPLLGLQALLLLGVVAAGISAGEAPALLPTPPAVDSRGAYIALAVVLALYGVLAVRTSRTFALTRRANDLVVVCGVVMLSGAVVASFTLGWPLLGFYLGHLCELVGIALVGIPVAIDVIRGAQSRPLAGDLSAAELVAREEDYLGPTVRALMLRLAEKDRSTEEHTRRVALLAVQIGERLGLPAHRLRELAIGGLLHDMGKLRVPDAILGKPGRLDDEEFAIIRRHPEWGHALLGELGGFSENVRRLVLDHHERLDGSGYPNRREGCELNLETRILAVCDVYDALISDRVYRDAWRPERALALLREEAGAAFCGTCVEALAAIASEPQLVAA
jgi:HD-GYP domain-containing protein (c-di-GMP phosphodiesterase class II)